MNYQEAIQYIHQTPKFCRESGNELFLKLLEKYDNPHHDLNYVHIAGTNGKGSTASMLSEILQASGYKTGLFTSPYIERYNERIQIDGVPIPDKTLAQIITELKEIIETYQTPIPEFALGTAVAFRWFLQEKVDIVILETGLGGRLDATNVIQKPLVSVITTIGRDHTQYLGDTLAKIAEEKCGIIKRDCPVVSYPIQEEEVWRVLRKYAEKMNSSLMVAELPQETEHGMTLNDITYALGLKGSFQIYNAATVVKTVEALNLKGYHIPSSAIVSGLKNAKNPARFETFGRNIILDGAHNKQAFCALWDSLKETGKPVCLCTAMMEDKDYKECVSVLAKHLTAVIATQLDMPRCCSASALADEYKKQGASNVYIEPNPKDAVNKALALAGDDGLVCICGSLYLAGQLRPFLKQL